MQERNTRLTGTVLFCPNSTNAYSDDPITGPVHVTCITVRMKTANNFQNVLPASFELLRIISTDFSSFSKVNINSRTFR